MAKNLVRHVIYLIINILVVAILIQVAIQVYHRSVEVGREFMYEFIQEDEPLEPNDPFSEHESDV